MKQMKGHYTYVAALVACATAAGWSRADIAGSQLGTGAPPTMVGDITLEPLPFRSDAFADVTTMADDFGRQYRYDLAVSVRQIGFGWATWSHGYTGNAFYSNGATHLRLTYPRGVKVAYLYVEPNPFGLFPFTVTGSDGNQTITETFDAEGSAGAFGVLFRTTPESDVVFVEVASDVDFAVGEFGISDYCPADLNFDYFIDFADFLLFLNYYDIADDRVDFTQDGLVDFSDYLIFLDYYGNSCEES